MHDVNWEKLFVSENNSMCVHTFAQKINKIVADVVNGEGLGSQVIWIKLLTN